MHDEELLVRHARNWAVSKSRALSDEVLGEVLRLRRYHEELDDTEWPTGSVEQLLLTTWPAYGPPPPDPDVLRETLDCFFGFLRATGRMTSRSADPAALRKEVRRALPRMAAAYQDRSRHSSGRVLTDFGRTIGIDLEGAEDVEELQRRLDRLQAEWNSLPDDERHRLMPDPSPKSARGRRFNASLQQPEAEEDGFLRPGDPHRSAQEARESGFVRQCLRLADWVGDGREVTANGLLRPAVAREAYRHLDLWPWERELRRVVRRSYGVEEELSEEADRILAEASVQSWRSAGDCLALDRLWYAVEFAGLVTLGARRARRSPERPETEDEWRALGVALMAGLFLRLGWGLMEPLVGTILVPALSGGSARLAEVRQWWDDQCPPALRDLEPVGWQSELDIARFHLADCSMWTDERDVVTLTDFGRDVALTLADMLEEGMLGEE